MPRSPLYESIIWLTESLIILFGSWLVFISEMSTLSDGSWAELSMRVWWWISWYRWRLMGGLTVLLLTSDYWTSVPVIGLITPVIGLRSL